MALHKRVTNILVEFSIPLIAGVVAAVVWANMGPESYHLIMETSLVGNWFPLGENHPINFHFLMNDIFMVFFFGIAAKEITEACLPGGALNPPKKAINPLFGTVGGVVGPVGAFFAYIYATGNMDIARGWGVPTATDIALAWLVAKVIFGKGHPAVSFLLLLAVADDGIGLAIIAIFYGDPVNPANPWYLLVVAAAMGIAYFFRRKGVKSWVPYLVVPGVMSWAGLIFAHLHPALALVFVVPFMPAARKDIGLYVEEEDEKQHKPTQHDTLNEFEHFFKHPVDFGLFGFGLANAGVTFSSVGPATWAILVGLVVGKTLGIFLFSAVAHLIGFHLPNGMNMRGLFTVGIVGGLGLTVALFVAGVAYTDPTVMGAAKMGAMLSAGVAPFAIIVGYVLRVRNNEKKPVKTESKPVETDQRKSA